MLQVPNFFHNVFTPPYASEIGFYMDSISGEIVINMSSQEERALKHFS